MSWAFTVPAVMTPLSQAEDLGVSFALASTDIWNIAMRCGQL
jgi:hypothetical protein